MATVGKKESCPCGSGRAYQECCYSTDVSNADRMEDVSIVQTRDTGGKTDFKDFRAMMVTSDDLEALCGLSREQMFSLLYDPFSSPELVTFNLELNKFPDSAFFIDFVP